MGSSGVAIAEIDPVALRGNSALVHRHLVLVVALALSTPAVALAEGPKAPHASAVPELAPLLVRLGGHGERLEEMKKRGSYTLSGRIERLDGDGAVDNWKTLILRIVASGASTPKSEVVRYVEDGEDKTADAKVRAAKSAKKKVDKKREFKVPFLPSEQPKYDFRVLGRDARFPGRVKVGFAAKTPAEDVWNGSAWVNEKEGEIESMGFTFSQNPSFVDEATATLVFGNHTELGRAPSQLDFEAKGGFLFIRRHYRGHASLTNAALTRK